MANRAGHLGVSLLDGVVESLVRSGRDLDDLGDGHVETRWVSACNVSRRYRVRHGIAAFCANQLVPSRRYARLPDHARPLFGSR